MTVPANVIEAAKKIKLLLLDVDGVLTDGRLYYGNSGEEMKAFNIQDGWVSSCYKRAIYRWELLLAESLRYSNGELMSFQ